MSLPETIYIFGCFGDLGHYFFNESQKRVRVIPYEVERACDGLGFNFVKDQPEGQIINRALCLSKIPEGWSFVSWWDRQGDDRGNSHTGILAKGSFTNEQLIEKGKQMAPWAFRVNIK